MRCGPASAGKISRHAGKIFPPADASALCSYHAGMQGDLLDVSVVVAPAQGQRAVACFLLRKVGARSRQS